MHFPLHGMQALWWLVPALALGELWRHNRKLWLCVTMHAWFNVWLAGVTTISPGSYRICSGSSMAHFKFSRVKR